MHARQISALVLSIGLVFLAGTSLASSCIEGGCHSTQMGYSYLHGPLAAEEAGMEGCASCHVSTGASCTSQGAGKFEFAAAKDALCTTCHEKSTGTNHSSRNDGCINCHSPHGSNDDANMLR